MSVRAYKVIKIDHYTPNTFNLWQDKELMDFLNKEANIFDQLNEDAVGIVEIDADILERALEEVKLDERTYNALKSDIEEAKRDGEEFISYYCY
jgi:hypothetical protein